ncbi:MAG: ESPR-type extended signal peptide-containing protein, partial [Limnohabitans sp.]
MNKFYRSIWNDVTQTFVAVSEIAKGIGKKNSKSSTEPSSSTKERYVNPLALEQRFMFDAAALLDLNGVSNGTDQTVNLSDAVLGLAAASATASDAENDSSNWNGGSLTIQRITSGGVADGSVNDVFSFTGGGLFSATGSISKGADASGTLIADASSLQFASWSYTSATGKLEVTFDTNASSALVQDVVRHIGYSNATPYGTATIRMGLNDGIATTTADVSVTSTVIYVDQTALDSDGDAADGFNLSEALAKAQDGDSILIQNGIYRGQFVATKAVNIDAVLGAAGSVTLEAPDRADLQFSSQNTINGRLRMPILDLRTTTPGSGTISVSNLTIDGRYQAPLSGDHGNGSQDMIGIATYDTNAVIDNVTIKHISTEVDGITGDYSGYSENFGILAEGSSSLASAVTLTVTDSTINTFQKTGILAWGPKLVVDIRGNTITAVGVHGLSNQNGMQIGSGGSRAGTTGVVSGNTIENIGTTSDSYSATGILLRQVGPGFVVSNNVITSDGTPGANPTLGSTGVSLYEAGNAVTITGNTFNQITAGILIEAPFGPLGTYDAAHVIQNNDFSSTDVAIYDSQDGVDPAFDQNAENALTITLNSLAAVTNSKGYLEYVLFGGNDSFTDTGAAPSLIDGGAGDDTLVAGSGDDLLIGGAGADTLTGGAGDDQFDFAPTDNLSGDSITDFSLGDHIHLDGRTLSGVTAGDGLNVTANAVEVGSYDAVNDTTTVYVDTDGDVNTSAMAIKLVGNYTGRIRTDSGDIYINQVPVIGDLSGDTVAVGAAGSAVLLDRGTALSISDTELGSIWTGASLTVQRVHNGVADASVHDLYNFNATGASFTVSGNDLQSNGQTFATFTSANGVLSISFTSAGTDATQALVEEVMSRITYQNDTPYGTATIRFALADEVGGTATADVSVTSTVIYVDQTALDSDGDAADGFNLSEALAKAQDGDSILIQNGIYRGQFVATKAVNIDAVLGAAGSVTLEAPDRADLQFSSQNTINGRLRMPILDLRTTTPGSGTISVSNLTIDGRYQAPLSGDHGNGSQDMIGIATYDTNAVIDNVTIKHISTEVDGITGDYSGYSENFGILAEGSSSLASAVTLTVTDSTINTFQKTGILAWGPKLVVDIRGNTITAVGVHGLSNQNGMQIGSGGSRAGTTGVVSGNTIENIGTTSDSYSATGILLRQVGPGFVVSNNVITSDGTPGANPTLGSTGVSLYEAGNAVTITGNTFNQITAGILIEAPFGPLGTYDAAHVIQNNDFSSTDVAIYDSQDGVDPAFDQNAENALTITLNSLAAVTNSKGYLEYVLFGGNDSFTDTGAAPSLIDGGAGDDTLVAGSGDDLLIGGAGADTLTGGAGDDQFDFAPTDNLSGDSITDFSLGDHIHLDGRTLSGVTAGDGLNVTANAVEVGSYDAVNDTTTVYVDTDGDVNTSAMAIKLVGNYTGRIRTDSGDIYINQVPVLSTPTAASYTDTAGVN